MVELGADFEGVGWVVVAKSKSSSVQISINDFSNHQPDLNKYKISDINVYPMKKNSFGGEHIELRYTY